MDELRGFMDEVDYFCQDTLPMWVKQCRIENRVKQGVKEGDLKRILNIFGISEKF